MKEETWRERGRERQLVEGIVLWPSVMLSLMPRAGFPADTYAVHSMAIGPYNLQRSGRIYGNREEQLSNKKKYNILCFSSIVITEMKKGNPYSRPSPWMMELARLLRWWVDNGALVLKSKRVQQISFMECRLSLMAMYVGCDNNRRHTLQLGSLFPLAFFHLY